ncbi:hypothetical protein HWB51_gp057 [Mycobacterium phage Cuke]|uniref:Uncharacterized protein n=1 Tax=Mycobacterium phage Cuke TaxID=2079417 RepID=A0A2L1IWY6_9CAUD|nr:hypothetical protein HWB51_gp057 [Mycobacterium phage Cuke]AVD99675.1 hypothetical protein SEA_CUKE_57 [Mycobacterium phage Cuke]
MIRNECPCKGFGNWESDCPIHGVNGRIWPSESYLNQIRGEVKSAMNGH